MTWLIVSIALCHFIVFALFHFCIIDSCMLYSRSSLATFECYSLCAAVVHPHSFSCKLELGSDQEIPNDWYPFVSMDCEIMGAVVSQTRVKSLGTANDIQPQKHTTSWTRYHAQVRCYTI